MRAKLDLTLLNRLVKEVNDLAATCDEMGQNKKINYDTYVVELSKMLGMMTGLHTEALALVSETLTLIRQNSLPPQGTEDIFSEAFLGNGSIPLPKKKLD